MRALLESCVSVARQLDRNDIAVATTGLRERYVAQEWFLLLVGETSSGKSTWINSILGEDLLPATPGSTTAAVTEVRFSPGKGDYLLECIALDGTLRKLERTEFENLAKDGKGIHRLRVSVPLEKIRGRTLADERALTGLVIVDAPGYNSCTTEHEETLRQVLSQADAVLGFLNWRRGVTPEDLRFFEQVAAWSEGAEPVLSFAVNFVGQHASKKLDTMKSALNAGLGRVFELYPLEKRAGLTAQVCTIWSDELWRNFTELSDNPERIDMIERHTAEILELFLYELKQTLELRKNVAEANAEQLTRLEDKIKKLRGLAKKASDGFVRCEGSLVSVVDDACETGKKELFSNVRKEVASSNRFTDAKGCGAYITEHLLSHGIWRIKDSIDSEVTARVEKFSDEFDEICVQFASAFEMQEIRISDPQWSGMRNTAAARGVSGAAGMMSERYLRSFGGQGGAKAGFVNLSKKIVSKTGRLFGKTFGKELYNGMGRTLKKLGVTANFTVGAAAALVLELAAYLYTVARWQKKLVAAVGVLLEIENIDEPVEDMLLRKLPKFRESEEKPVGRLGREIKYGLRQTMSANADMARSRFEERIVVLEQALNIRVIPIEDIKRLHKSIEEDLEAIMSSLNARRNGGTHVKAKASA